MQGLRIRIRGEGQAWTVLSTQRRGQGSQILKHGAQWQHIANSQVRRGEWFAGLEPAHAGHVAAWPGPASAGVSAALSGESTSGYATLEQACTMVSLCCSR